MVVRLATLANTGFVLVLALFPIKDAKLSTKPASLQGKADEPVSYVAERMRPVIVREFQLHLG